MKNHYYILFFVISCSPLLLVSQKPEGKEEPKQVKDLINEKTKLQKEAERKAREQEEIIKKSEEEQKKYKEIIDSPEKYPQDIIKDAIIKEEEWRTKKELSKKIQQEEADKAEQLKEEIDKIAQITKEQEAIASTFSQHEDPVSEHIKEEFEKCIKRFLLEKIKHNESTDAIVNSEEFEEIQSKLAQKLKEIFVYQRTNFYKNQDITEEQWQKIHANALAGAADYSPEYKKMLEDAAAMKSSLAKMLNNDKLQLPTTKQTEECFIKNYPALNKKLEDLEKDMETADYTPWD